MTTQTQATGKRIRDIRERAGYSQRQIANKLSLTQSYISKLEKGERELTPALASKYAAIFRMPVAAFQQN